MSGLREELTSLRARRERIKAESARGRRRRLSARAREEVLQKTGGRCHVCGGVIREKTWQADHLAAHSTGGSESLDNYLAAHASCNNYRWDYLPEEFLLIMKLGVWARTQVERNTVVGQEIGSRFSAYDRARRERRARRRKSDA